MLPRKYAIKMYFIFPPHLTNACALPGETKNTEIASFHLNSACFLADRCNATFGYCHEMSYDACVSSVTRVYCGQTVSWIRMPLGMEVGLGPSDIVLDGELGTQLHPPKGAQRPSPIFSAHVYCGQTAAWIRMPRGMQIGRCWVRLYSVHATLTLTLCTKILHL